MIIKPEELKIVYEKEDDGRIRPVYFIDAEPVRYGHWIWNNDGMDWGIGAWCCSECGSKAETWWATKAVFIPLRCSGGKFCGNCGAKMFIMSAEELINSPFADGLETVEKVLNEKLKGDYHE